MTDEPISLREFFEARERIVRLEAQRDGAERALDLVADSLKVKIDSQKQMVFMALGFMTLMIGAATLLLGVAALLMKGH